MHPNLSTAVVVFAGAGLGGLMRHAVAVAVARSFGTAFPYGTLAVNVCGGFMLGLFVGLWAGQGASPAMRAFLVTGLLGGFTTFSAFTLETVTLVERQQAILALAYILASVSGAVVALVLGMLVGRHLAT